MYKPFILLFAMLIHSCSAPKVKSISDSEEFKISVAEWSLHRTIQKGEINHLDFARVVKDSFNIKHIEYVSQFFQDKAEDFAYLDKMKEQCLIHGVTNLLIMVDGEGELGATIEKERVQTVQNHKKWVKAAQYLGCKAIRVNGNGLGDLNDVQHALIKSLQELSLFALDYDITIIVENHGMMIPGKGWSMYAPSTNGKWLAEVFEKVNMPNCKALPDFGNFDKYDRYQGMRDLMPHAFGVSAKTYVFNEQGEDTQTNFQQIFDIIHSHDFNGFVGVEFEGPTNNISEYEGIRKTIDLVKKHYK
jgi:sugar phosphate isomerase/epimerase